MIKRLDKLAIKGFKSISSLEAFELKELNVLIGGNGAGKSNFVELFVLLREMFKDNLNGYVVKHGGADSFLFNGPKQTAHVTAHFSFGPNEYRFELEPTADEKFLIKHEEIKYERGSWQLIGHNSYASQLSAVKDQPGINADRGVGHYVYQAVTNWMTYHFHDTSIAAPMRRSEIIEDNKHLRSNAANIAPYLLMLRHDHLDHYNKIVQVTRLVTPFFDDFILEPIKKGAKDTVKLAWKQKGSDYPMQPYHFSDGTIRFICLATALLQPKPPSTIIIDEPELGLHPYAVEMLSELIQMAKQKTQVIISTQSPTLVDYFGPEDIIVVNREKGASTFQRLDGKELALWLKDYSLGELWRKNIITGAPVNE